MRLSHLTPIAIEFPFMWKMLRITPTFSRLSTEALLSMPSAIFPPPCFTLSFKRAFSLDVSVIPETWGMRKSLEAQNWISGFVLGSGLRKVTATEYRNPFQNRPLHLFAQNLHEGNTQIPCHIATLHFGNIYSIGLGWRNVSGSKAHLSPSYSSCMHIWKAPLPACPFQFLVGSYFLHLYEKGLNYQQPWPLGL